MPTVEDLQAELNKSHDDLRATENRIASLRNQISHIKSNIRHKFSVGDKVYVLFDERRRVKVFSTSTGWLEILRAEVYEGTISELIFNQNAVTMTPMYTLQLDSDIMSFYEKDIFNSSESAIKALRTKMQDELAQVKFFMGKLKKAYNEEIVILNSYKSRNDDDV